MRCRFGQILLAAFCAALFSDAAFAGLPKVEKSDIDSFRQEYGGRSLEEGRTEFLKRWQNDAKAALLHGDLAQAARALAPKYGFSPEEMREFLELWLLGNKLQFPRDESQEQAVPELHARFAEFAARTGYKKLALEAAVTVMAQYGHCRGPELETLISKAPDRLATGWIATRMSTCPAWERSFLRDQPAHAFAPLVMMAQYTGLMPRADYLALYGYLTSDGALAHVDPADRAAAHARLAYSYASDLWSAGLIGEAVTYVEHLPVDIRETLLDKDLDAVEVHADGLAVALGNTSRNTFRLLLSGAYVLNSRPADAERIFAKTDVGPAAHAFLSCALSPMPPDSRPNCPQITGMALPYLLVDHVLHHPNDDPYDLAETFYAGGGHYEAVGAVWSELTCRVFIDRSLAGLCETERRSQADSLSPEFTNEEETRDAEAAIREAGIGSFEASRAFYAKALEALVAQSGWKREGRAPRASIDPAPSRFAQLPLPDQYRGKPEAVDRTWIGKLAPLPNGYMPVRAGRNGKRVAVISLSQNYDPTGEVSQGGYWVHLSDDGGKTWREPLYTGLAEFFPYVVLPDSRMPLFDGDALDVAVDIRLLDTASITYPPVMLQSKRHETNLYLRIPIADLERDSDGDGLTDIAEEHLLLDPHNPDTDGDGIPDGIDPMPNVKRAAAASPEQKAVELLLEKLFSVHTGAIIEPMDVSGDPDVLSKLISLARRDPTSADRPIFVSGDPQDFAGLNPNHMMLIYNEADLEKLRRMSPDFHPVSFGKIIFNRAHDRGYFVWSAGWMGGGTVRLRLVDGSWVLEEMSSWIS